MGFSGLPESALVFFEGLEADNSKTYWTDHREVYDDAVRAPLQALLDELEPEFGAAKVFRPHRDVRFSKDKSPYKTQAAAAVHGADGDGALYLALSAQGLFLAGGYWQTQSDQVRRLRDAVADDASGRRLVVLLDRLLDAGFEIGGEKLKRVPKPWDGEHPRAGLLLHKSLTASRALGQPGWLHTPEVAERVADAWRAVRPLNGWLARHVGPHRDVVQH